MVRPLKSNITFLFVFPKWDLLTKKSTSATHVSSMMAPSWTLLFLGLVVIRGGDGGAELSTYQIDAFSAINLTIKNKKGFIVSRNYCRVKDYQPRNKVAIAETE